MKALRTIAVCLAILVAATVSAQAASGIQAKKAEAKPQAKASMPKEVSALIQEGLATRQGRQDIPFSLFKQIVFPVSPTSKDLFPVFFFKAKNGDLGYIPSATGSGEMEANLNVFFQFFQADATGALKSFAVGKPTAALKTAGEGYKPEAEDWYSFGLIMPPGNYTLALVLASQDMRKMSVAYADVALPPAEAAGQTLWTSDPVVVKDLAQVEPDQRMTVHQGCFLWGAIRIVPTLAAEIAAGENLEVLFFVHGPAAKDPTAPRAVNDLEVNFEVQTPDGKVAKNWPPQSFESFFIDQPLPMKLIMQTTNEKGEVIKSEEKPLEAGKYVVLCHVTDKVAGTKTETKLNFEIK